MNRYRCSACSDTGWYGDNGPGILGNSEFIECDNCEEPRVRQLRLAPEFEEGKFYSRLALQMMIERDYPSDVISAIAIKETGPNL